MAVKLIHGTDEYLVSHNARKAVNALCPESEQTLSLETVDGDVKTIDEAVTALLLWHDRRCGQKFVGRRYPGWHDYLSHLLAGAAGYQGNRTIIGRLLGDDACSECDARSCG